MKTHALKTAPYSRAWRGVAAVLVLTFELSAQGQPATFAPTDLYTVGSTTYSATAGDLDDDGSLDLVAVNFSDRTVSILLNSGDGTFGAATTITPGTGDTDEQFQAVALGDVDANGTLDAVVTGTAGTLFTLFGAGDGTFPSIVEATPAASGRVFEAALADLDLDGDLDLVLVTLSRLYVYDGDGAGGFTVAADISLDNFIAQRTGLAVGDFNGDGRPDVAVGNGDDAVIVTLNDGAGGFPSPTFYYNNFSPVEDLFAVDLDGDLDLDLAAVTGGGGAGEVLLNNGDGTFAPGAVYDAPSISRIIDGADFDLDGNVDLLIGAGSSGVSVVRGQGDGTFHLPETYATGLGSTYGVAAADFNGNGKPDFVATDVSTTTTEGLLAVRLNTTVTDSNSPPVATDDEATTTEGAPVDIDVLANDSDPDGDPLTVESFTQPTNGQATDAGGGTLTYSPDIGFTGSDSFTYTVADGNGGTDVATVSVTVTSGALVLAVSETVGVSDAPALHPAVLLAIQESIAVSDEPDLLLSLLLSVAETIAVRDDPNLVPALLLAVQETITVSDEPDLLLPLLLSVVETIAVTDAPNLTPALVLAIQESIAVRDDPELAAALLLRIQELIAVSDTFGALLGVGGLINALEASVADLFSSGALIRGQAKSLLRKLTNIRKHVERERYNVALSVLDSFVNQVESFREEDALTDEQAGALFAQAQALASAIAQLMEPARAADETSTNANKGVAEASQRAGEPATLPAEFSLAPSYPNPFHSRTIIPYALPEAVHVRLEVYDALGRTITALIDGEQEAGHYAVSFEANGLASGVYLYRLTAGSFVQARTMTLVE